MRKHFITGLVLLLPLAVTTAIVAFIVNMLTKPFVGIVSSVFTEFNVIESGFLFLSAEQIILYVSRGVILLALFLFIVGLGIFARRFFFKSLITLSDSILHRIPLVNKVYKTSQEIIKTIFSSDKNSFKQVVMVPFPKKGSYIIGLISREAPLECSEKDNDDLFSVLIPTTPNPTTGFLLMYKREEITFLDMKPEEAVKYIVSCGVIVPKKETEKE